ncbi:MAG: circularly permuted type 2 ATP-grasp protein [Candidatus Tectomicrobia bacterium]|nr:circularly permuted type 2 ATP-grasp protein [Candidatus Tectomicrobia bacterium]
MDRSNPSELRGPPADPWDASARLLFERYETDARFFDETFESAEQPRAHYRMLIDEMRRMPQDEVERLQDRVTRSFLQEGITFTVYGDEASIERAFPIDCVPRLLLAREWAHIERGLIQRVQALNLFLSDVYHKGHILRDGTVPRDLVYGCPNYQPEMEGVRVPLDAYVSVCGSDVVRTADGFMVLEDNLRVPSGVSYMLACRHAIRHAFPQVFRRYHVRPVEHYGQELLRMLRALAPPQTEDPSIALLTPGVYNSAYYEHAFLAREMGIELVKGDDLLVQDGRLCMRTVQGLHPVDVLYRRIDDNFIDPQVFRPDSRLGVPGLFEVYRSGRLALANAPGNGVADDKAVYSYVPDMIRYYLDQDAILDNVETHLCREPEGLTYTLENLEHLVVKAVGESGGYGMLVGPHASQAEREAFAAKLRATPENYIAQPTLDLSRAPCLVDGRLEARHVDLRPFVLHGEDTRVVPGGLCRVALNKDSLVVNSSQGGGAKDAWILEEDEP